MARYVELRRHTDADGDVLTQEGARAATEIGARLDGGYDLLVSTGAQRATQTLACFLAALGERVPGGVVVEAGLRSWKEERWRKAYEKAGSGALEAMRAADPEFVEADSAALGAALGRVLDALPGGGRALVVGHSPTNEAAVLGLTGEIVGPSRRALACYSSPGIRAFGWRAWTKLTTPGPYTYPTHLNPVIWVCMTDDPEEARRWARELAARLTTQGTASSTLACPAGRDNQQLGRISKRSAVAVCWSATAVSDPRSGRRATFRRFAGDVAAAAWRAAALSARDGGISPAVAGRLVGTLKARN